MSSSDLIRDVKSRALMTDVLGKLGARMSFGRSWDEEVYVYCLFCEDAVSHKPAARANNLKGLYFCFHCGFGGDVIKVAQEAGGLGFDDALQWLIDNFPEEEREDENPWRTT